MSIDLSGVRAFLEETVLTDTATVARDVAGVHDDELGDDLILRPPPTDLTTVWSGLVAVLPRDYARTAPLPGGLAVEPMEEGAYLGLAPLDAPVFRRDDLLTVAASERDPQLAGVGFRVLGPGRVSTFAVVRIVPLDRWPAT